MMINENVKRGFAAVLAAGMVFGCVPVNAESDAAMMENGYVNEASQDGFTEITPQSNIEEEAPQGDIAGEAPQGGIDEDAPQGGIGGEAPQGGFNGGGPGNEDGAHGPMGPRGGGMGGGPAQTDPALQAVIDENASKFEQFTYTDEATGITLEYSLYIPEGYEEGNDSSYPMVMFIPDSTGAGLSSSQIVEGYYGAAVWAGDEDQQKHPSFVLVPAYTGTVTDDNWNASEQLDATVSLITYLTENYSIDTNRLYTTGQSMGCMSSLYLNSKYPDLFAASLYVSGQWDISVLDVLEDQTFFYVTAGGDEKASGGQDEVMALFDADQVSYSYESWDAQEDAAVQNEKVQAMIDEGSQANMIRFETGTVLNGGNGMEHMASFNYAYKISALRDWLFEQSK